MIPTTPNSTGALWARFRFSVVGSLLSSPPARGTLQAALCSLADKTWSHPVTGRDVQFAAVAADDRVLEAPARSAQVDERAGFDARRQRLQHVFVADLAMVE